MNVGVSPYASYPFSLMQGPNQNLGIFATNSPGHALEFIFCQLSSMSLVTSPSESMTGFPGSSASKESACKRGRPWFDSWVWKISWWRDRLPTPVFLGFSGDSDGKESACNAGDLGLVSWSHSHSELMMGFPGSSTSNKSACKCGRPWFDSRVWKISWRRDRVPTPVFLGFSGDSDGKESACNAGDLGSVPVLGRSSGEGKDYPLQ